MADEEEAVGDGLAGRVVPLEPLPGSGKPPAVGSSGSEGGSRVVPLEPLPQGLEPLAEGSRGSTEPEPSATAARVSEAALIVGLSPLDSVRVEAAVRDWAQAWSDQRVEDYLEFYARDFEPPRDLSREQWRRQRRDRVSRPLFVSVTVDSLAIGTDGADSAWAEFVQSYRASSYSDTVVKRLDWVREDEGWKIAKESVVSVVAMR